jgi:hypothetical protein
MCHRRFALVPVTFALLTAAMPLAAQAQGKSCQALTAIIQGSVVTDPGTMPPEIQDPEFGWGGVVYAGTGAKGLQNVSDVQYQRGWFYGTDSTPDMGGGNGKTNGQGRSGRYMFAFGTRDGEGVFHITDGFTIDLGQATWVYGVGSLGLGHYHAAGKMSHGFGRFEGATGTFTLEGDFAFWPTGPGPLDFVSAWNPNLVGSFCK